MTTWDETQQAIREHLDDTDICIRQTVQYIEKWTEELEEGENQRLLSVLREMTLVLFQDHLALKNLNALVNILGSDDSS